MSSRHRRAVVARIIAHVLPARVIVFLILAGYAFALDPQKEITQYVHQVWRADSGLPENFSADITQTKDGYLWLGTSAGPVRFDGVRFKLFSLRNLTGIRSNGVFALAAGHHGGLWIGTGDGLVQYKDGAFKSSGLAGESIFSLSEADDGTLWVGTTNGLAQWKDDKVRRYTTKEGLPSNDVRQVVAGRAGDVWLATPAGITHYRGGEFITYTVADGLTSVSQYTQLLEDHTGQVWVGRRDLQRFQNGRFVTVSHMDVNALAEDRDGNLWIGSDGGLARYSKGQLSNYNGFGNVHSLFEDDEGGLWVKAGGVSELHRFSVGPVTSYSSLQGLANDEVWSLTQDREGDIWIGTSHGLSRYHDGNFRNYSTKDGLPDDYVVSTFADSKGNVWIGTVHGLSVFRKERFFKYSVEQGLGNEMSLSVYEDREGDLWATSANRLLQLRNGRVVRAYGVADGLSHSELRAIAEDSQGDLWVGSNGDGIFRLSQGRFTHYTAASSGLPSNIVLALYADNDGAIWIGTEGAGIARYKDGRFTPYSTSTGLYDDVANQILEDDAGRFWIGSSRGIYRVEKKQLNELAQGKRASVQSLAFGTQEGMRNVYVSGGVQPAGWKAQDGKLWFPTAGGVSVIDSRQKDDVSPLATVMEEVNANNQWMSPGAFLEAAPGEGKLEFHYTAFHYDAPQKVQFRYRLEGFEKEWVDADGRRAAYYTNIRPGRYRFRVQAASPGGAWSGADAGIELYLAPHFYQTYWFLGVCVLGAAFTAAGAYRLRIRQLRSRQRELERLVNERTRELREEVEERKRAEAALEQARDELEDRVRERTAELEAGIAERKRVEDQLRQAQKMEAIGKLAGGVAHDFNNLLTVIKGYSNLLLNREPIQELRNHVERIDEAAERAASLTRQLLAFSRQQVLQLKVLNLNRLVLDLDKMLRRLIGEDLELVTVTASDLGSVRADPGQIQQVILNLVVNARDAMPNGGKLTLETANVEFDETYAQEHVGTVAGRYVMLAVSDTGIGMSAETQAHIFDPFFTTKGLGKGTGLGLSTVYGIVKQSGGYIWIYSELERGTTFKIYLPRVDAPAEELVERQRPAATIRGHETILLVEDDRRVRELADSILTACGYSVLTAENPQAVASMCEQHPGAIDLLLTDVVMPGLSGRELANQVQVRRPEIKVLYMSGYTGSAIVRHDELDAGTFFLPKPFTPGTLANKVREVLDCPAREDGPEP